MLVFLLLKLLIIDSFGVLAFVGREYSDHFKSIDATFMFEVVESFSLCLDENPELFLLSLLIETKLD